MNSLRPLALAALCASALSFSQTAAAQGARAGSELKRLSVTVAFDDHRSVGPFPVLENVSEDTYSAEFNPPEQLPGWKRPDGEPPLTAIRLRLAREGDAVRIKVFAVLDDTWPPEAPGPKYGKRVRPVGAYLVREGETVVVGELKDFGLKPLSLAASEAKPEPELPFTPAPARAVSRLKSIEVVSFLNEGANMERARLVIRNVSQKPVVGVEVGVETEGYSQTAYRGGASPLIEPGGTYEMQVSAGRDGPEPAPQPEALVVGAALFADDSYEGDAEAAAKMFARQRGRAIQLARVVLLLRGSLDKDMPAPEVLAEFKARVAEMRIDVSPPTLEQMLLKFPALRSNDDGRRIMAYSAVEGLRSGRDEALAMIEDIERAPAQKGEGIDLRRILDELGGRVARQVGSARD
jgi:hypothetical protein